MKTLSVSKIKETCLYVKDLQATRDFYEGILGLPLISAVPEKHIFFRAGSSVLLCFNPEDSRAKAHIPSHYGSGNLHFAFEVEREQYEDWKQYLQEKGIEMEQEVKWKEGLYSFYFRDPDGHCVEIAMPGIWGD